MLSKSLFIGIIFVALYPECNIAESDNLVPPVKIKTGKISPLILKSDEGRSYYAFKNIPYGKSTSGERRFKPPEPADPWDGILESTSDLGPQCPQYNAFLLKGEGVEDCLVANVYTPKIANGQHKNLLPVLVFIHGGAFSIGTGSYGFYGPERLIDYGIVLVTFNYRLGILGFLNTQDDVAPGNYGMLDQVLALKWVQENIEKFGGDKDSVTIFGESAGSASVIYHLLSPLSKGLFHRAIAQSGTAMNSWAFQKQPLRWAQELAEKANCPTNDTKELVNCLKGKTVREIIAAQQGIQITIFIPANTAPYIDGPGGLGFLIDDPMVLLKEGRIANKVPFILGLNELEGLAFHNDFSKSISSKTPPEYFQNEFIDTVVTNVINSRPGMEKLFEKIKEEYFSNMDLWDIEIFKNALARLLSDILFGYGITETADHAASAGLPTWTYMYTHLGKHSLSEIFGSPPGDYATHMDEIFLQFPFFYTQYQEMSADDKRMSKILNTLWTDFAKGKNLTAIVDDNYSVYWQQHQPHNPSFLKLNLHPELINGRLLSNYEFWNKEIPKLIKDYNSKSEL